MNFCRRRYGQWIFPTLLHFLMGVTAGWGANRPSPASADAYTLKDLEILSSEKNYREFFQHARDIRPSWRDAHWKEMVNSMAMGFIEGQLQKKNISPAVFQEVEGLREWPQLRENDIFMRHRDKYGILYFQKCFQQQYSPRECQSTMRSFWLAHPHDPYVGLEFAKLLHQYLKSQSSEDLDYWIYLQKAVNHDLSNFLCKDPLVKEILFQQLERVINYHEKNPPKILSILNANVNQSCWDIFRADLEALLRSPQSSSTYLQKTAYLLLKIKNQLPQHLQDVYLTLYLLQGPVEGDLFNQSWNNLKELGQHLERRLQVLNELKQMDPLPGKIFSTSNLEKKSIILDYLSKHFPEYMDTYARTCLDYLEGRKIFENGNPTPSCKDLIRSALNSSWVDSHLQKSILKIQKL